MLFLYSHTTIIAGHVEAAFLDYLLSDCETEMISLLKPRQPYPSNGT